MFRVIDASGGALACFGKNGFEPELWERYMDGALPAFRELCLRDMQDCVAAGYGWEEYFLPTLNAVRERPEAREQTVRTFRRVTGALEPQLFARFGKTPEADLVLYLGLCSGAGWVVRREGRTTVLFGLEKILELGWYGERDMRGLVLHELGHVWHGQFGALEQELSCDADRLLWQLFTEGVATVFAQEVLGDPDFYHQDKDGWRLWCARREAHLARCFADALPTMTPQDQNWFGDWVRFEGMPDVGYFLGARFVRFLLRADSFARVLCYGPDRVRAGFGAYLKEISP